MVSERLQLSTQGHIAREPIFVSFPFLFALRSLRSVGLFPRALPPRARESSRAIKI